MPGSSIPCSSPPQKRAWVTLLTRTSYLPGAVLLAQSLHAQNSRYVLLILLTPSFPPSLIPTLRHELALTNSELLPIEPLFPAPHNTPASLIASRFEDTWTKLRVFELHKNGYEKLVFLDADMLVLQNMDELFEFDLPNKDWIAANHACVCNLDGDAWAPSNWTKENCAYTGLAPMSDPTPVPVVGNGEGKEAWSESHRLLNSGMFIFEPHQAQWERMLTFLKTDMRVKNFLFPDQDFLAAYFLGKWKSISWQYNALKTMRYWHSEMWSDAEVRNLHFIVDKPWSKRVGSDGVAGYRGGDGITHSWWWREYEAWEKMREEAGETEVLEMMRKEVAPPINNI
ncbi:glycosyl transferase [Hyphodiscus hymeniophilus]|uniref:Glycosyl transferase n=1 Tax=Hyphodiscus hymeniophilus TaxID=353542 RepID=A0A9P6SQI3_9HELO|nr:glycosyl transferase [Hyphodiscus hymeniophilus]